MKSYAINCLSHIITGLFLIIHVSVYALWLPPLLLDDQQALKSVPHKEKKESVILADASGIGKTHFLIGGTGDQPSKSVSQAMVQSTSSAGVSLTPSLIDGIPLNCDGRICSVLFDKFYDTLTLLIEREQKKISMAAYMFTDKRIARLLEDACARGVIVEVVTDLSCLRERSNKLGDLYEAGVTVFICMPERKGSKSSLMHNKFILFDTNIYGRKIVWTGSANMTRSALTEVHHENVVVLDDPVLYQSYEKEFAQLKKGSERYEDCTITNAALHEKIRTSENAKKNTQTRAKLHAVA